MIKTWWEDAKFREKIKYTVFLHTLIPIALFLLLGSTTLSIYQSGKYNREINYYADKCELNINNQLAVAEKNMEILISSNIIEIFTRHYETPADAIFAINNINQHFNNFYLSDITGTGMMVFHNNKTLYKSTYSSHLDELDEELYSKIKSLPQYAYFWQNDDNVLNVFCHLGTHNGITVVARNTINMSNVIESVYGNLETDKIGAELSDTENGNISRRLKNGMYFNIITEDSPGLILFIRNYVFAFVLLLIVFFGIMWISNKTTLLLTKKIDIFLDKVNEEKAYLNLKSIKIDRENDLSEFMENFVDLINRINDTHQKSEKLKIENYDLRLRNAQSQINPHLLYNSLSGLRWECMEYSDELVKKIDLLIDYYRLSIADNTEDYTFGHELNMIKIYVELMSALNDDCYSLTIDFEEELKGYKTIQHIFQPLVENAILHAKNSNKNFCISVSGQILDNKIILRTTDNGYGMDETKLCNLRKDIKTLKINHGLSNTYARIKLFYGDDSDIQVYSDAGGTEIIITVNK